MKYTPCFIVLTFFLNFSSAQTNLDSLYGIWEDENQKNSVRIDAFQGYIWNGYLNSAPDSALIFSEQLYEFSELTDNNRGMAIATNLSGAAFWVKGNYRAALKYYKHCLEMRKTLEDHDGVATMLNNIGNVYLVQGLYIKALDYYQKSLVVFENLEDKSRSFLPLNNIGVIYQELEDYPKALEYALRSLKIKEALGDKQRIASSLNNIANVYIAQEDFKKGLEYAERSMSFSEEAGDLRGLTNTLMNIGILYKKQRNYSAAIDYNEQSLKISKKISYKSAGAVANYNIGSVQVLTKHYRKAISNCEKSLLIASDIGIIETQELACQCLYESYKAIGNGTKALGYHEQMLVLNDSLQSEETAKKLQQMEFAKQVMSDSLEQVEKELKTEMVHQAEVRKTDRNRNLALGAGFFFLVLSGGFFSRWRYVKKSKAVIEKEKDRSDNLLLNILPSEIAEELKEKGSADARDFELVSILFSDFKGFTQASEKLSAKELIHEINTCFKAFDLTCEKYGVEKIKTIGDAYMAAGGLPVPSKDSVRNTILAAIEMQAFISKRIKEKEAKNEVPFRMRLGIHTGPVVAGIVGVKKFQYDIWGDTVNTASRMESSGEIGKVNISAATYTLVKDDPSFNFEARGHIMAKGKGEMKMYFVSLTV